MLDCPTQEQLTDLLSESLPRPDADAIEGHVGECSVCQETLVHLIGGKQDYRWLAAERNTEANRTMVCGPRKAHEGAIPYVPGFEIQEELGRGGMGVVYKARQLNLGRLCALKMILVGANAGPELLTRFHSEAEAVARLAHPNIVSIYDVSTHAGLPYYTMELIEGPSLKDLLGTPRPPAAAAHLIETLAHAIHYAHERGIVHRDLKPANVLLSRPGSVSDGQRTSVADTPAFWGTAKITDFGLAKRLDTQTDHTPSGQLLGTPDYMAPEQARGQTVGPATDVYALGAILYECLTGRPPFQGISSVETVLAVLNEEPVPPSRLQPRLPRDLVTICLKCLHKDPAKRYASALALAEDLGRFLAGEPIQARATGALERLAKWTRRQPAAAALWSVCILAGVGLIVASVVFNVWLRATNTSIRQAKEEVEQQRDLLDDEQKKTKRLADAEARARADAERERDQVRKQQQKAEVALYALQAHQAFTALEDQRYLQAEALLEATTPKLRSWEYGYLLARCRTRLTRTVRMPTSDFGPALPFGGHAWPRAVCECNHSGTRMAVRYGERTVLLWDLRTGEVKRLLHTTTHVVGQHMRFSSDDSRLAFGLCGTVDEKGGKHTDSEIMIADAGTGKLLHTLPGPAARDRGHSARSIHENDPATGESIETKLAADPTRPLEFSADGKQLAATGPGTQITLWDVETGKSRAVFDSKQVSNHVRVVRGEGGLLVVNDEGPLLELRDLLTGEIRHQMRIEQGRWQVLAISGRYLVAPRPGAAWANDVLDLTTGKPVGSVSPNLGRDLILFPARRGRAVRLGERVSVMDLREEKKSYHVILPAGRRAQLGALNGDESLLAYSEGPNVHVLHLDTRKALFTFRGQSADVLHLQFLPDGRLLTLHSDRAARFWNLDAERPAVFLPGKDETFQQHSIDAAGRHALVKVVGPDGRNPRVVGMRRLDLDRGIDKHLRDGLVLHPGGGQVASHDSANGAVTFHDIEKDQTVLTVERAADKRPFTPRVHRLVCYSPGGDLLTMPRRDPEFAITVVDARAGKVRKVIKFDEEVPWSLAFSPDSKRLAIAGLFLQPGHKEPVALVRIYEMDGDVPPRVLCATTSLRTPGQRLDSLGPNLVWSADGRCLAGVCLDKQIRIVDVATGEVELTIPAGELPFIDPALTPDNKRVLVAVGSPSHTTGPGEVCVFERGTGQKILAIPFPEPVRAMSLSRDGTRLVVVTGVGTLRILKPLER